MKAKVIVLFNHKGGVSKTTTTFNIAWKLTQLGKRVLVVDGDPQCNLTNMFLGNRFFNYYENKSTSSANIKDAVSMAFAGSPRAISPINCVVNGKNEKLFLIPGHMDLSEYESALSLALTSNNAIVTLQNLPGSFYELIKLCCGEYDIDYVFIDMNPGLGAINQSFFMCADAFIVPTNPDPFSVMALKTLRKVLPRWKNWSVQAQELFKSASYPLPNADMKFIGEIIQRFNIRNKIAATSYKEKIDEIKKYVEGDLSLELNKNNMLYDIKPLIKRGIISSRCLGEIAEFGSLLQKANKAMVPVFAVTKEDMHAVGKVYDSMERKRELFDNEFSTIGKVILELLK
jgi:chromosome partitioning protein